MSTEHTTALAENKEGAAPDDAQTKRPLGTDPRDAESLIGPPKPDKQVGRKPAPGHPTVAKGPDGRGEDS